MGSKFKCNYNEMLPIVFSTNFTNETMPTVEV